MYAKCGMLKRICIRDVVPWNALIVGYAQCSEAEEAMRCFNEMKCEDIPPNVVTFSCILKACGSVGPFMKENMYMMKLSRKSCLERIWCLARLYNIHYNIELHCIMPLTTLLLVLEDIFSWKKKPTNTTFIESNIVMVCINASTFWGVTLVNQVTKRVCHGWNNERVPSS